MKTLKKFLGLIIVACVMGSGLTHARPPDVGKEIERLHSSEPNERATAARVLGNIGDTRAVGPLISILNDEDRKVRLNAVSALRWIGDPRAVEPFIAVLKDEDRDVRRAAAQALGQSRDPRAAEPLIAAFREWPSMSSVGGALKNIGEPAVEPLIAALKDENAAVRAMAAETQGNIRDPRSVEPLISVLNDEDRKVRLNAAKALRWMGDPRAVEPLIAALKEEDIKSEAADALRTISRKDFGKNPEEWQGWWDENKQAILKGK